MPLSLKLMHSVVGVVANHRQNAFVVKMNLSDLKWNVELTRQHSWMLQLLRMKTQWLGKIACMSNGFDFDLCIDTWQRPKYAQQCVYTKTLIFIYMYCVQRIEKANREPTKLKLNQTGPKANMYARAHAYRKIVLWAMLTNNLHHSTRKQMIALYILCSTDLQFKLVKSMAHPFIRCKCTTNNSFLVLH